MLTIADTLKYANLQMAAEAILYIPESNTALYAGQALVDGLKDGNNRSLKFTQTQAETFAADWIVLAQMPNTATGFSGTLFKSIETGERVLSFRSTEFIDRQRAAIIH